MATVDILLPLYNGAATLIGAVTSLQHQTFADIRLIVIDDGSTDESATIIQEMASHDERITVLTQKNSGIVDALNAGLGVCTADYIARQDADDVSNADRLQLELSYLQQHPDCIAISGAITHVDETGNLTGQTTYFRPQDAELTWLPAREPHISHPFLMVRRAGFDKIGGYRHVYHAEDADLYWRLYEHGRLHSIEQPIGLYRMHSGSVSSASVVDGRIMALSSQLAALSALRRRRGENDIAFPKDALSRYRSARTLERIVELGAEGLTRRESAHLRIAASLKLLELATYRPYVIDTEDCRYIRDSVAGYSEASGEIRDATNHLVTKIGARLLRKGLVREVSLLTPPRRFFSLVPRLMFDCMPASTKKNLNDLRSMLIPRRKAVPGSPN
jgi:glycosyltransferase involved in cell wall biosynthesis